MKIIRQIGIIFFICWLGQLTEALLPFAFPASVIGMLLLFLLLVSGLLRVEHVREKSDFLLANMAFFFIPAGVNIMNYFDVIKSSVWKLLFICLVTMILTFLATVWSIRLTLKLMETKRGREA